MANEATRESWFGEKVFSIVDEESPVAIISTGGQIDGEYKFQLNKVIARNHSAIPVFLNFFELGAGAKISAPFLKVSTDVTDEDRTTLTRHILDQGCRHVVVVHGYQTMGATMRDLAARPALRDHTIVFTGSEHPLTGMSLTDAPLNLGAAWIHAKLQPPGIYAWAYGELRRTKAPSLSDPAAP